MDACDFRRNGKGPIDLYLSSATTTLKTQRMCLDQELKSQVLDGLVLIFEFGYSYEKNNEKQ